MGVSGKPWWHVGGEARSRESGRRPLHWSLEAGLPDLRAAAKGTGVGAGNKNQQDSGGLAVGEKGA